MPCSNKPQAISPLIIPVGARSSPLSRVQVKEVLEELQHYHPFVHFDVHYLTTIGDRDQTTSLRTMERTDFFTRDIDHWVLAGDHRIAIHSAKDLTDPLASGLKIFCLTRGVDNSDALVLRSNETLQNLPTGARIATSSLRREEMVRQLRTDLSFCDLRGTIEQRLAKLDTHEADGVVVAEAALIRLGLTHYNRIRLPGQAAAGQGQLAVVGREEDRELQVLFSCLNVAL